jgi:hypothetical protein
MQKIKDGIAEEEGKGGGSRKKGKQEDEADKP